MLSLQQLNEDQDDIIAEKAKEIGDLKELVTNEAVLETK